MIHKDIARALDFSPVHKDILAAELRDVGEFDYLKAAHVIGVKCRELGIRDFPNPFNAELDYGRPRACWLEGFRAGWDGEPLQPPTVAYPEDYAVHPEPEPVKEVREDVVMSNFAAMSKRTIDAYIEEVFGVKLDGRKKKADLIAEAEKVVRENTQ